MPKTRQKLTKLIQARVTAAGEKAIIKAAERDGMSVAEFVRRCLYKAAGYPKPPRGGVSGVTTVSTTGREP